MPYTRDFDLVIPNEGEYISPSEILPGFREYLTRSGLSDPSAYDHYRIRIIVRPHKCPKGESNENVVVSLVKSLLDLPRKVKRRSFGAVDSVFITLASHTKSVVFREIYPPTTRKNGEWELNLVGTATISAGVDVTGAKAAAELQAKVQRDFSFKAFTVVRQQQPHSAIVEFRKRWFEEGKQPEIHLVCSVPRELANDERYIRCQRRVTSAGREIIAPRRSSKITLPRKA